MPIPIKRLLSLVACVYVCLGTGVITAQTPPNPPTVVSVEIVFDGFKVVSEQYIRGNIQVKPGDVYDQLKIDDSVESLYRTALFEFIDVDVDRESEERVAITFNVRPKYRVGDIEFEGNDRASDRRLLQEVGMRTGVFIDEFVIKSNADKLVEYYQGRGFSDVSVDYRIDRDLETGVGDVIFLVDEGDKIKIDNIRFSGNEYFSNRKLRGAMETKEWSYISWLTGNGKFDTDEFRESIDAILNLYREEGFLDVFIDEEAITQEFPDNERNMIITIPITEGEQYYLGSISIEGNTVYTDGELLRLAPLVPGSVFSPESIDEAQKNINDYYGSRGYLDSFVRAERIPNMTTGRIDIEFQVRESEKIFVENINIEGNTTTKTIVILRELALAPGDVFDMVTMERDKLRLENSRYFENVNISPEDTNIPGRKNLRIVVQEGRTGNFTFGAGFSSLEQASFFTEVSMGNFDLFNWRSFFQGDGQKFRLRLSIGSRRNSFVIDFQEPWLFERRLAFGVQLFREETENLFTEYNQDATGFSLSLRQRLIELVEGIYSYRLEQIEFSGVDPQLLDQFGPNAFDDFTASRVGFTLLRDTRDRIIFTRRGNRVSISNQVSGTAFGGNIDNLRTEIRIAQFIPTFDLLNQSLAVLIRTGSVVELEEQQFIRPSERFYLGGPDDLRGFDFRRVGPKIPLPPDENGVIRDSNISLGGQSYNFLSLQYGFQIGEQFQFVTFYDWGVVNDTEYDFGFEGYNDNVGFGIRIMVMGAPMRLDYGIPLTTDDSNDEGGQFHFTFGTRF